MTQHFLLLRTGELGRGRIHRQEQNGNSSKPSNKNPLASPPLPAKVAAKNSSLGGYTMRLQSLLCAAGAASLVLAAALPAAAQHSLADPVVAAPNPESLFHSKDPKLDRNKQAALHIEKDLLESH